MYTAVLDDKPLELKKELAKELSSGIRRLEDVRTPFLLVQNVKAYLHIQLTFTTKTCIPANACVHHTLL